MSETDPIERRMLGAADKDYNSECADELREGADEITSLRAQLEEARAKAIEEAAKIAGSYRWNAFSQGHVSQAKAFEMLADDIRALIAGSTK